MSAAPSISALADLALVVGSCRSRYRRNRHFGKTIHECVDMAAHPRPIGQFLHILPPVPDTGRAEAGPGPARFGHDQRSARADERYARPFAHG